MSVNWSSVESQIVNALQVTLSGAFQNAVSGVKTQVAALIAAGRYIEQNEDQMTAEEYTSLQKMQTRALEGVLQTYKGISLDIAEQAAAAAWNTLITALKAAYPALAFLP